MVLRPLLATDAEAYQVLRLRSLQEHPEAFALALEDEQQTSVETVARRLEQSSTERYVLGAFEGENLVQVISKPTGWSMITPCVAKQNGRAAHGVAKTDPATMGSDSRPPSPP
jgi:hypothetical protein